MTPAHALADSHRAESPSDNGRTADGAVRIKHIGVHLPPTVPLDEQLRNELHLTDRDMRIFRRLGGFDRIAYAPGVSEARLVGRAIEDITDFHSIRPRIRYVVRVRSARAPSPYPRIALDDIVSEYELHHAAAFTMTDLACATGLTAVSLVADFLAEDGDPDALGLILVGEKCLGNPGRVLRGIAPMGEATAAVVVGHGSGGIRVLGARTVVRPSDDTDMSPPASVIDAFVESVAKDLPELVDRVIGDAGLHSSDIKALVPSIVSRRASLQLARHLGLAAERVVLSNVPTLGHCFSADPFINLVTGLREGTVPRGVPAVLATAAVGSACAAMVIEP